MKTVAAFFAGVLFSTGLIVSGMTLPENIVGFLDFFGDWKPALALVMVGAVLVYAIFYPLVMKQKKPLFDSSFSISKVTQTDARLLIGATAFGVGWGLSGLCPGPALVSVGAGALKAIVFAGALVAGVLLHHFATANRSSKKDDEAICG